MPISTPLAGSHIDYDEPCTFCRHALVMVISFFLGRPQNAGFRYEIEFLFPSWNAIYMDRRLTFWIYRARSNHTLLRVMMIRFYTSRRHGRAKARRCLWYTCTTRIRGPQGALRVPCGYQILLSSFFFPSPFPSPFFLPPGFPLLSYKYKYIRINDVVGEEV